MREAPVTAHASIPSAVLERPSLPSLVAAAGLAYFALAQAAFATIGQATVLGITQAVAQVILLAAALVVFLLVSLMTARRAGTEWRGPTVLASAAAAMIGALSHTLTLGTQVAWGERCNQCTPVAFLIEFTLLAGAVAAVGALPVGFVARRLGRQRAGAAAARES